MTNAATAAVGMSGGVDSTVAALLLLRQGYKVIGITMSTWDNAIPLEPHAKSGCYGPGEKDDILAAKQVCEKFKIPHYTIDLKKEYRDNVLDYFTDNYKCGKTPNPCVACNRKIKFAALSAKACREGIAFDYFATGHYAQSALNPATGRYTLKKARDSAKDQSYFLWGLEQNQLAKTLFPLGGLAKSEVRQIAKAAGLTETAEKAESQDFIEAKHYNRLFADSAIKPGPIYDIKGQTLGEHKGIIYYTVGQRKGIGIGGAGEPLYVVGIDSAANAITVGPKEALLSREFEACQVNWVSAVPAGKPFRAQIKIRRQHEPAEALVTPGPDGCLYASFDAPQFAVTPGQSAVFYDGDTVIAGGIIKR